MELTKILSGEKMASKRDAYYETENIRRAIIDGAKSPLPYFVAASYVNEVFQSIIKDEAVRQIAVSEIEKYGKVGFSFNGAKVEVTSRSDYDYSTTPEWLILEEQINELKAKQRLIEKTAQTIPDGIVATELITEDGEVITVFRPLKKSHTIIKTTLPK
jgi:bisphosphoglycerate-independent phosphoglycerate mutase (AlkP superfamily)